MSEDTAEYLPLAGSAAEKLFVRQADLISCGPACLASAAKLYGIADAGYACFRALLRPDPAIGSVNEDMAEVAAAHLPVASAGENTYHGGVAVANIMQGEGHYVLFLRQEGDDILYYDPEYHELAIKKRADIEWVSESGHLKNWSVNFAPLPEGLPRSIAAWRALARTPDPAPRPQPAPRGLTPPKP